MTHIIGRSCHKYNFCRNKSMLVMTKVLSRQKYVCRDKIVLCLLWQNVCHDKYLSRQTTKLLSRQKWRLWRFPPMTDSCLHLSPKLNHHPRNLKLPPYLLPAQVSFCHSNALSEGGIDLREQCLLTKIYTNLSTEKNTTLTPKVSVIFQILTECINF